MRSSRRVAVVGFVAVVVGVTYFTRPVPDRLRSRQVHGGFFDGNVPNIGNVHLGFWSTEEAVTGSLADDRSGRPQQVVGTRRSDGDYCLATLRWGETNWVTNVVLVLKLANGDRELDGKWISTSGEAPARFHLDRCATVREVRDSFRMRIGRYGHNRDFACPEPSFDGDFQLYRDTVEQFVRQQHNEFMSDKWSEVWQDIRWPTFTGWWQYTARCQIRLLTADLCSVVLDTFPYRGGCGNWERYATLNCWVSHGQAGRFELSQLFRADSEWEPFVRHFCARDLHRQRAVDYENDDVGNVEVALDLFTVSSCGIQIYFNPYEVGSGAEGAFIVQIPFSELADLMATNGPGEALLLARKR